MNIQECESGLLAAIEESVEIANMRFDKEHRKDEARSKSKLIPVHGYICKCINNSLNNQELFVCGYGVSFEKQYGLINEDGKELPLPAEYIGQKRVDIAIAERKVFQSFTRKGKLAKEQPYTYNPIAGIFYRGAFNNMAQNKGNYFSSFIADSLCLRRKEIPVGQIFIVAHHAEYHTKDGSLVRLETFEKAGLKPYLDMYKCSPSERIERPDAMCVMVVDVDGNGKVSKTQLNKLNLSDNEERHTYSEMSDFSRFIEEFSCLLRTK